MASANLTFDVSALDSASKTFARMATAVDRFERRLEALDGKRVDAEIGVKTDKAEREIGQFARDMHRRITAAVRSLPEIEITADSTDADRELAQVRADLVALGDRRIGVDIDAGAAEAELARLDAALRRLGSESADVQVQADTAGAVAALKVVGAEVDRLDGRTATVKIDVDRGLGEAIVRIAQLGRALGTLALPAAAVALGPQLAGIGSAVVAMSGALGLIPAVSLAAAAGIGALVIGMQGFGDALKDRGDPAKFAEALAKLSPAARAAAVTIRDLGGAWREVQQAAQESLFAGAARDIQRLSTSSLPALRTALVGLTGSLAAARTAFVDVVTSARSLDDARVGLANTQQAANSLAPIVANVTEAFRDLSVVGSSFLPGLAQGLANATDRFAAFIAQARQSGELAAWMQRGIDTVAQLGRITADVGRSLGSVFDAADAAGVSFLDTVERITSGIDTFLSSAEGGQAVTTLFREIGATVDALAPGVARLAEAVVRVISTLAQAGVLRGAAEALSAIAIAAAPILELLGQLAAVVLPPLLSLLKLLSPVLVPVAAALIAIKAATSLTGAVQRFPAWLMSTRDGAAAAGTGLGSAANAARRFCDELRLQQGLAAGAGQSVGRLGAAYAAFETSQLGAVSAARQFGAEVTGSYGRASSAVQGFATTAGGAAREASTALGDRLAGAVNRGVESIIRIPAAAGSAAATLRTGLGVAAIDAAAALRRLPAAAQDVASTLKTGVGVAAINAGEGLQRLATSAASAGRSVATGLQSGLATAVAGLRQLPLAASLAGQSLATGLQPGVTAAVAGLRQLPVAAALAGQSLGTSLRTGVTAAVDAVRTLPTQVGAAVSATGTAVANGLRTIPNSVQTAFSGIGRAVDGGISALGRFTGAVAGVGASIGTGLMRAGSSLVGFLGGPWGVALAAAGVALAIFAGNQAKAAQAAADHNAKISTLAGTLNQYSGSVTQATKAEQAKDIAGRKLADGTTSFATALTQAGVSLEDYTAAASGNEQALAGVNAQLSASAQRVPAFTALYNESRPVLDAAGVSLETFTAAAIGNEQALAKVGAAFGLSADELGILREEFGEVLGPVRELGGALGQYSGQVAEAQAQTRTAAQAAQDFGTTLDTIKVGFAGLKDGAAPTAAMAAGFKDLASAASAGATAAGAAAAEFGGVAAGAAAAEQSMQQSRQAFIDAATGAGLTADAAGRLADSIGLVPATARTDFLTNATQVTAEIQSVKAAFDAVPGAKSVIVSAPTAAAIAELQGLGLVVTTLPDGRVEITAPTDAAKAALDAFVANANTQVATVTINGDPVPAQGVIAAVIGQADSSVGTMQVHGDATVANNVITQSVTFADGSTGTITVDANQAPADGKITATVRLADGSTGTVEVDANTAAALAKVGVLKAPTSSTHTVNVAYNDRGFRPGMGLRTGAGGGLVGYAAGGLVGTTPRHRLAGPVRRFDRGGTIPGYAPGRDTVPAILSRGEAVLVPELVRQIGPRNVLAANYAASHRQPTMWAGGGVARYASGGMVGRLGYASGGMVGRLGTILTQAMSARSAINRAAAAPAPGAVLGTPILRPVGSAPRMASVGSPDVVAALRSQLGALRSELAAVADAVRSARPITVEDRSGDPVQTARATVLALRI